MVAGLREPASVIRTFQYPLASPNHY